MWLLCWCERLALVANWACCELHQVDQVESGSGTYINIKNWFQVLNSRGVVHFTGSSKQLFAAQPQAGCTGWCPQAYLLLQRFGSLMGLDALLPVRAAKQDQDVWVEQAQPNTNVRWEFFASALEDVSILSAPRLRIKHLSAAFLFLCQPMCPADPPLFAVHCQEREAAAVRGAYSGRLLCASNCCT